MKVLLVNGSPNEKGCTYTALREVKAELEKNGVEGEIVNVGREALRGCAACGACAGKGACVFDDAVNRFGVMADGADGFVFGSPVYYAHPSARLLAFMDRAFYSGAQHFACKPAAAVLSARRAGQVASMDVILKHFTINRMPVVSSTYWNHVFGAQAEEVRGDLEGLMTMRNLGLNMAWLLKCIDLGRQAGLNPPHNEKLLTNFIR